MSRHVRHDVWDPEQYGRFRDERSRPFFELVGRVGAVDPVRVVDLGCGSGELTATLADRWPAARVEGIDGSAEMIKAAERHAMPGRSVGAGWSGRSGRSVGAGWSGRDRLRFSVGDLAHWRPDRPVDVIVSNAALQWVPTHRDLLPHWVEALNPGGWLAFQVPGNFDAPSHTILRALCRSPRWRDRLGAVLRSHPVAEPDGYLELLSGRGCRVDVWETTYLQVLPGDDPVLEWVKGTALRPVLGVLDAGEAAEFLAEYAVRLREAYPRKPYGTPFPFRRIFVVACREHGSPS